MINNVCSILMFFFFTNLEHGNFKLTKNIFNSENIPNFLSKNSGLISKKNLKLNFREIFFIDVYDKGSRG